MHKGDRVANDRLRGGVGQESRREGAVQRWGEMYRCRGSIIKGLWEQREMKQNTQGRWYSTWGMTGSRIEGLI